MKKSYGNRIGLGFLIGAMFFIVSVINCKKEEGKGTATVGEKQTLSGVVLLVVGDVQSGTKKLKTGDIISVNESVKTGKKSICDFQIKEIDAGIVIRMKADSELQLKSNIIKGKETPSAFISKGRSMINVSKKLKNDENFNVVTPTSVAGVRGTKFEVNVSNNGESILIVSEGKVAVRVRIAEAEQLPQEIQEQSVVISSVKSSLESHEQIIETGNQTVVTKEQTNKILKDTGLGESIKQIQISPQARLSPEEVKVAVSSMNKNLKPSDTEILVAKSVENNSSIKVGKVKDTDLQSKLKEYAELISIEKQKLETVESTNVALKERVEKNKEILMKRMEETTGKNFETLILKSGKKIQGIIFLENDQYSVITLDGQEIYTDEEVKGLEL